ncbi:hypothetical protein LY76DRAFT_267090 [Colletotrichum caudatum]|nr:hypothetical protein LY76DRAFT_267090 [Colletotrichum caudatum]
MDGATHDEALPLPIPSLVPYMWSPPLLAAVIAGPGTMLGGRVAQPCPNHLCFTRREERRFRRRGQVMQISGDRRQNNQRLGVFSDRYDGRLGIAVEGGRVNRRKARLGQDRSIFGQPRGFQKLGRRKKERVRETRK